MNGTEKQVRWAEAIRAEWLALLTKSAPPAQKELIKAAIEERQEAAFFIYNRGVSCKGFLRALRNASIEHKEALAKLITEEY